MKCLVLAFETLEDLPVNWQKFSSIDVYGLSKINNPTEAATSLSPDLKAKLTLHNKLFLIRTLEKAKDPYTFCFVRHPDPWGEARSWMKAICALGETLSGNLECKFWFTHEIIAFDFLLRELLGQQNVRFIEAGQLPNIESKANYQANWAINPNGVQKSMLEIYEQNKVKILEEFYNRIGQLHRADTSLKTVRNVLSK